MVLSDGTQAPEFEATTHRGDSLEPSFETPTVLYFYPEDGTPGCTREAEQFQYEFETYREAGVTVLGVSTDRVEDHQAFAEELGLDFTLISDPHSEIAGKYDVEVENERMARTTYVIVDGRIHSVYENVDPDGHARSVLMDLLEDGVVEL